MALFSHLRSTSASRTSQLLCVGALLTLIGCDEGGGLANPPEESVVSVRVVAPAEAVQIGETMRLTAVALNVSGQPIARKSFTWKSSDETIATVSTDGVVTTKREGSVVITATSEQQTGEAKITITPQPLPPGIGLSPATVSFTATAGQSNPQAQSVSITNTGSGAIAGLTATVSYAAGQPTGWLSATLSGTSAPVTLTLQPNTASLQPGTYSATVAIRSPTSGVAAKNIAVTLVVNSAPAAVAPTATTGSASAVTTSSATLSGTVNPNGQATSVWFEWGSSTPLGNATPQQALESGTSPQSVSANLTGLTPGTTYYFRVVAQSSAGTAHGAVQSFTTAPLPVVLPPAAPSNLSASKSGNQIRLTWRDNSGNETEFRIERKQGQGGSWSQIATVGANVTSYDDAAPKGPTFYYRVRACNSAGCSGYSNQADEKL